MASGSPLSAAIRFSARGTRTPIIQRQLGHHVPQLPVFVLQLLQLFRISAFDPTYFDFQRY